MIDCQSIPLPLKASFSRIDGGFPERMLAWTS